MGRNAKFDDEVKTKSIRFPLNFINQCPAGIDFTDWLRFDVLNISKDGKTYNSHNAENISNESPAITLLMKLVPLFAQQGLEMEFTEEEIQLMMKIMEMVQNA